MNTALTEHLGKYRYLKQLFSPKIEEIPYTSTNPHPLQYLVLGESSTNCAVAQRTDKCCQLILENNKAWLQEKIKTILQDQEYANVSATLGEIRAYGELLWASQFEVSTGKSGSDFSLNICGKDVKIEVNTPQHKIKRNIIDHEELKSDRVTMTVKEIFPFGWPEREKDNVQCEAVSKIAAIKKEEHQLDNDSINILWLDIKDPVLWQIPFGNEQFAPLVSFQENITSGAFWSAFYARKGTPVYDQLNVEGLHSQSYIMEYDGRFQQQSLIDFVIADTCNEQIIFQNFKRNSKIPLELFKLLHKLFAFNLQLSWFDWPVVGQLEQRVAMELEKIQSYNTEFAQ